LGITSTTQLDRERAHKQWVHEFELVCM
jgi:hypothetical protein